MDISAGSILVSTPLLNGTFFEKKVILLAEYNEQGALGFVINTIFHRKLNELVEFSTHKAWPLFNGGPVKQESLFFIHRRPDIISGGTHINERIFSGGDFNKAIHGLDKGRLTNDEIKIFIGYCGWDAGELEAEINEGSWVIRTATAATIFSDAVDMVWDQLR